VANKSNKSEYEKRLTQIYELLICGTSTAKIIQFTAQNWGIESRQSQNMIASARKQIIADQDLTRHEALAEELSLRNFLLINAIEEKKWAIALQICDSRTKLRGLAIATDQDVLKEYRDRKLDKTEQTAKEVDAKMKAAGLDEATAAQIRMKILGITE